ncbi:PIN-like domain-containing protein [Lysinibacillus capsici]|uniref:PIN-like domain-containing protein n=1 Tax=Lysinibacillus capsici TaxID=2115968 RepID=UPI000E1FDF0E|nr:PIN-like domain-containing protein [Lysinibacillus capsici]RDV33827.1 hypothetical protein C7B89_04470 [Lysinibacillus capsici]
MIQEHFGIYTEPQNENLKAFWSEGIFIFDTSALLSLYYLPKELRKNILEKTLTPIKDRIWIPQHVLYEFLKNRESKIKEPIERKYKDAWKENIDPINKLLKSLENHLTSFQNATQKKDSHPYIENEFNQNFMDNFSEFKNAYLDYEKNIKSEFTKRKEEILSVLENDDVLEFITSNLKIGEGFTFEEIMDIVKEGELRYRNTIPPGYKDLKNKEGTQIYGDLIVWKQILQHTQTYKKPVIFILNDVKIDWCYSIKHRGEDRIVHPRHELIKELYDSTNCKLWMYTFNQFLYNYSKLMDLPVEQSLIDEATLMITENQPEFELLLDTGSTNEAIDFVTKNRENIGKLKYLNHYRDMDKIEYETTLIGEKGSLKIKGGLTSGYAGAGPNGFIKLLTSLGLDKDVAHMYVKGNHDKTYSFEINFNDLHLNSHKYGIQTCPVCGNNNWNGVLCLSCGSMCDD